MKDTEWTMKHEKIKIRYKTWKNEKREIKNEIWKMKNTELTMKNKNRNKIWKTIKWKKNT